MHKILTIVGARPQFIKAAAVSHAIKDEYADRITEDILHTGQHYDDRMSGRFFSELDIPQPKYNLGVGSGTHGVQTAAMLKGIEEVLMAEHYDGVLVYGDTNSTLAGALAAAKMHIPVFHVEAGLRSFNRAMPEELNRVLTDHASTLLFAPTQTAVCNLRNEGITDNRIVFSGDIMLDNVKYYSKQALSIQNSLFAKPFLLATVHRDFNTDNVERLKCILSALNNIAEQHGITILFPIHPRTRKCLDSMTSISLSERIEVVDPFSYLETLAALQHAHIVLTDSGGLQKESYFCGKPCVVLRPETEWVEIVESGSAILSDADPQKIADATARLWDFVPTPPTQFGDGNAAKKIMQTIALCV